MPYSPVDMMIGRIGGGEASVGQTTSTGSGIAVSRLDVLRQIYTEKFGINQPLIVQYVDFWKRFFTMDYGLSYWRYPTPVSQMIMQALPWTLVLIIPVVPIGFFVGNWIGSRAAYRRGRVDKALYYVLMFLSQAPYYWFALILMLIFGSELHWFPLHGAYDVSKWIYPVPNLDWFLDAAWHYCLPFLSLIGLGIGSTGVGMRAMTLYEMESDYIQYSKQLGFKKNKLRKYSVRNAILPNFTWLPVVLSSLVGQTLLVELIFGWPGLGSLAYQGVFNSDYPLIEATFIFAVGIVLVGNFICDILYGLLDPRIGSSYVGAK
jgi:peptide/nickel transport system permease protein